MKTNATPKLVNLGLKRDLKEILAFPDNIDKIYKGVGKVTDYSIEIWFKEPATFSSYVYYENKTRMLSDYSNLLKLIENAKNSNEVPSI
jgi:hypothetical protein